MDNKRTPGRPSRSRSGLQRPRRSVAFAVGAILLCGTLWTTAAAGQAASGPPPEIASLKARIAQDDRRRPELSIQLARQALEERRRIARELHDEMGQQLAALRMEIAVLRKGHAAGAPVPTDPALGMLLERVDGLVVSVRRIVAELRPPALDGGLASALHWLAADLERQTPLACEVEVDECASQLPPDAAAMVFRIAQESLNNIRRHAAASKVSLHLGRSGIGFELVVRDDGGGFDSSNRSAGFGILGMEERARALGGTLAIRSRAGEGTEVRLQLPLSECDPSPPAAPGGC